MLVGYAAGRGGLTAARGAGAQVRRGRPGSWRLPNSAAGRRESIGGGGGVSFNCIDSNFFHA